ncbi:IS1/IS1595 family N-terminal zinc-binding domain-containing protein [Clostridium sp. UBA5119]|uniref:IS1/IS1595 family N-terminal zinc-binding domain-containing protein n=1 Tax=Clostridium sp. UBA5119 TaxID=1946366 RepID=UPI003218031D
MSSPNYHEVLALARELKGNERIKLILDISKTMNDVLRNKKVKELCCPYCDSSRIIKNGKNKTTQRYLCKTCLKSFISVTNTPIYYSRKEINTWNEYIRVLGSVIKKDSVLVTDSLFSYKTLSSYSKSKYVAVPTGSRRVGSYNIQRINNLHSKVKSFMMPYKGVSTKYLSNYMFLFKYIESECEATPIFFRGKKPYFSTNFKGRSSIFS